MKVSFLACSLVMGSAAAAWAGPASDFSANVDGWNVADCTSGGTYVAPVNTYAVTWSAAGGVSGGYIYRGDPSSNSFFFNAPGNFLGDESAYSGGVLKFSLKTSANDYSGDRVIVLVGKDAGGTTRGITELIAMPLVNTWNTYYCPLRSELFRRDTPNGPAVSAADFAAILSSLTAMRLPGEFGSQVVETSCLDSVALLPACDANADGKVDDNDLNILLTNWGTGTQWAQGNFKGTGTVDDNDLNALLSHWTGSGAAVPEPVTMSLLAVGGLALLRRRL